MNTTSPSIDYIVVGGGSAGCVVASRLSEDASQSVLLLEAGRKDRIGLTKIPSSLLLTIGNSRYDWCYQSEPDPTRNGTVELWPRGRMLGGSSGINGMVFIRGAPSDYDAWAELGNANWDWQSVLPFFQRLENAGHSSDDLRGFQGPLDISLPRWRHPLTNDFIDSAVANGFQYRESLNGANHEGVSWAEANIRNGKRLSAYDAYIAPHLKRPNLQIQEAALVTRVIFEGKRAVGVAIREGKKGSKETQLHARKGVILCAGAINSPHLLLLSGIGAQEELAGAGITQIIESPDVGQNLMEHSGLRVQAEMSVPTLNSHITPLQIPTQIFRWLFFKNGPISGPAAQALAFCRSNPTASETDLQVLFFAYGSRYGSKVHGTRNDVPPRNLATFLLTICHPASRGYLSLRDGNPTTPIAIHPQMLSSEEDIEKLLKGMSIIRRIAETRPISNKIVSLLNFPKADAGQDTDLNYIRNGTHPFYHPAGTCRMGSDEKAVVTPDLKVRGAESLWVADASIMPRLVAGNIHATTLMIGEKASDLIGKNS